LKNTVSITALSAMGAAVSAGAGAGCVRAPGPALKTAAIAAKTISDRISRELTISDRVIRPIAVSFSGRRGEAGSDVRLS
jgi:hypothetical protein